MQKFQDFGQVIIEITQRVVTALDQANPSGLMLGQHFSPIQHLVAFGDHGQCSGLGV
jgi:hypothetical protein